MAIIDIEFADNKNMMFCHGISRIVKLGFMQGNGNLKR
jgi:hypothetical protein